MKKHLITLFVLFLLNSNAQSQFVIKEYDDIVFKKTLRAAVINQSSYINIKGSPYLNSNFQEGKVKMKNDTTFALQLRYNIYNDIFEYQHGKEIYGIANLQEIKEIELDERIYIYYNGDGQKFDSFYELLVDGKCILISKKKTGFKEKNGGNGIIDATPAQFIRRKDELLLINNGSTPILIKKNKDLLKCLNNKSEEIGSYIKSNKLSLKQENDIVKIVKYYNSIL